jgi:hypothetical protein
VPNQPVYSVLTQVRILSVDIKCPSGKAIFILFHNFILKNFQFYSVLCFLRNFLLLLIDFEFDSFFLTCVCDKFFLYNQNSLNFLYLFFRTTSGDNSGIGGALQLCLQRFKLSGAATVKFELPHSFFV